MSSLNELQYLAAELASGGHYETVAASQSDQALGAAGAKGDFLRHLIIIPGAVTAGTVSIKDGSGGAINVFVTGTLTALNPIIIPIGARSTSGAWKVSTGADVTAIAIGQFT